MQKMINIDNVTKDNILLEVLDPGKTNLWFNLVSHQ